MMTVVVTSRLVDWPPPSRSYPTTTTARRAGEEEGAGRCYWGDGIRKLPVPGG